MKKTMYTLYIPKYKGENAPFAITEVIRRFMITSEYQNDLLLMVPGFMSTTSETIEHFIYEFDNTIAGFLPNGQKINVGLFYGMNGNRSTYDDPSVKIRKSHEDHINSLVSHTRYYEIKCRKRNDHRKMIFFISRKQECPEELNASTYETFLNKIEITGVLLGSSNQRDTTYYGVKADKGEADILMFWSPRFARLIQSNDMGVAQHLVLSKRVYPKGDDPCEFFRKILEDYLNENLL